MKMPPGLEALERASTPLVKQVPGDDTPLFAEAWEAVYGAGGPYAPPRPRPRKRLP